MMCGDLDEDQGSMFIRVTSNTRSGGFVHVSKDSHGVQSGLEVCV